MNQLVLVEEELDSIVAVGSHMSLAICLEKSLLFGFRVRVRVRVRVKVRV